MTDRLQIGAQWLASLLEFQGLSAKVSPQMASDDSGDSCWLVIDESSLAIDQVNHSIGDKGEVLDSIQYLVNTILNLDKPQNEQLPYTVELAGYRAKRIAELREIAADAAEKAMSSGQEFEISALSSAERRQVHHFLKDYEGLETFSRGKEPDRRLVVRQAE